MLSLRDPIHGFIRADEFEQALINSRPMQRLRSIHQLGLTSLVFPGAEHSRFSHVLGAMELAGRLYDALAAKQPDLLEPRRTSPARRLVRAAALLHDIGHAPFSHSAEDLFEGGIDHEEMTCRMIGARELRTIFEQLGGTVSADAVVRLLRAPEGPQERLLSQIVTGELDVDKMDYLRRDSLYCGVSYGNFDLDRLIDTVLPIEDPETGEWGIGVDEGGVHALEALVMARYYMFTQVYFNVTGKVLELHLNEWLRERGDQWPADPETFLEIDDVSVVSAMRASDSPHAQAVLRRLHYPLAFQTREHLDSDEKGRFEALLPEVHDSFPGRVLVSNSTKDPHRLRQSRVLVQRFEGRLETMENASQFIRHLTRIEQFRVYSAEEARADVRQHLTDRWND